MRKVIHGHGIYRPYRPPPPGRVGDHIVRVLDGDLEGEYQEFLAAIRGLGLSGVSANKTGRRVLAKLRVLGHSMKMSLPPYDETGARTVGSVVDEIAEFLSLRTLAGSKTRLHQKPMSQMIADAVTPLLSEGEYCGRSVVATVLSREVVEPAIYRAPGPVALHRALTEFVSSGGHLGNFESHQRSKAIDSFRQMACHAFKNGATLEDMIKALEEEMVRATMEA